MERFRERQREREREREGAKVYNLVQKEAETRSHTSLASLMGFYIKNTKNILSLWVGQSVG